MPTTSRRRLLHRPTESPTSNPVSPRFDAAANPVAPSGNDFDWKVALLLAWMAGADKKPASILGTPATQSQPGGATPVAPPTSGGVLDTLKKVDEQQPPSGPQAPRSQ